MSEAVIRRVVRPPRFSAGHPAVLVGATLAPAGGVIITMLDMLLPAGQHASVARAMQEVLDATRAHPGCMGGGVYEQVGHPEAALYVELWRDMAALEDHIRTAEFGRLLAILETSPAKPSLTFHSVSETRNLAWVETLRLHRNA